jgi:hypothetical protein
MPVYINTQNITDLNNVFIFLPLSTKTNGLADVVISSFLHDSLVNTKLIRTNWSFYSFLVKYNYLFTFKSK